MAPLAPHEKIFVDTDFIEEDANHGWMGCHDCHGGNPRDPDWKTAHKGVVKDPTFPDAKKSCGECHEDSTKNYTRSLHYTFGPMYLRMEERANPDVKIKDKVMAAAKDHCGRCHSSCGQCHISRPDSVEGGLMEGHIFQRKPPMKQVCTACHGSRIGKEYFGENKGFKPDVHHEKYMKCDACHSGDEMHGDGKEYAHRYDVENGPECEKCHSNIYDKKAKNVKSHTIHRDKVSCSVCHSQAYKNCSSCHVAKTEKGKMYFNSDPSTMQFKIGLNPLKSEKRPEKYVTVRHVPVNRKLFDFYVRDGLTNFDKVPTWKYTTPHNIQRVTEQNKTCNACHGVESLFLMQKDVVPEEKNANKDVIVSPAMVPKKVN